MLRIANSSIALNRSRIGERSIKKRESDKMSKRNSWSLSQPLRWNKLSQTSMISKLKASKKTRSTKRTVIWSIWSDQMVFVPILQPRRSSWHSTGIGATPVDLWRTRVAVLSAWTSVTLVIKSYIQRRVISSVTVETQAGVNLWSKQLHQHSQMPLACKLPWEGDWRIANLKVPGIEVCSSLNILAKDKKGLVVENLHGGKLVMLSVCHRMNW